MHDYTVKNPRGVWYYALWHFVKNVLCLVVDYLSLTVMSIKYFDDNAFVFLCLIVTVAFFFIVTGIVS